jgi:MraZ protein
MIIFGGHYRHSLDSKGRLNIPAQLRKILGSQNTQLWITPGLQDGCLFVYPQENWIKKMEELNAQADTLEKRKAIRVFSSQSFMVDLDTQGRIIVPSDYQKLAKMDKEVVIAGVMDKIELWNPQAYEKFLADNADNYQQMVQLL